MFVQIENTPNPNSLKFLPGKIVSNNGSFEISNKDEIDNELIRNLLSIKTCDRLFLKSEKFFPENSFIESSKFEFFILV